MEVVAMADSLAIFRARSQLMAHAIGCPCQPCRDARRLVDDAAAEHRRKLYESGDAYVAETHTED